MAIFLNAYAAAAGRSAASKARVPLTGTKPPAEGPLWLSVPADRSALKRRRTRSRLWEVRMSNLYLMFSKGVKAPFSLPPRSDDEPFYLPPPRSGETEAPIWDENSCCDPIYYADSVADRRPSPKNRGSSIGFVPDPFRQRLVYYESGLEYRHLVVLMVNPNITDIREQQRRYFTSGGRKHHYTADFVVTWRDRGRIAYEVKYAIDAKRKGTLDLLRLVSDRVGDDLADEYRLLTEHDVNDTAVKNAKRILWCARESSFAARQAVRQFLSTAPSTISAGEIAHQSGTGPSGLRAAIALIQQGVLSVPPGDRLTHSTKLRNHCTQ